MKVKIIKTAYAKGAETRPPKKPLADWYNALKEAGYTGPMKPGDMQKWMVQNHPEDVLEFMNQNPPSMNTNKGRAKYPKDWSEYSDAEKLDAFQDNLWDFRDPAPELEDATPQFATANTKDQARAVFPMPGGNQYSLNNNSKSKEGYRKRNLPFYQAAPDIASFVAAQNTYNYYTPDYTHWEVNPATMNIQPQLNSIDASARAYYDTTTGDPVIDNIRKQGAFAASVNAKQQPFATKQNYDANMRYQADVTNINARTQEQNLDTQATEQVHNQYRALAKDFAAGERLRAINSLTRKYALNERNENMKKLWLDNFFPNVTSDGVSSLGLSGNADFYEKYYPESTPQPTTLTISTSPKAPTTIPSYNDPVDVPGQELNVMYSNDMWGNPVAPPVKPTTITTPKPAVSPVIVPDEPIDEILFDPIRNQMNPTLFKKGGKKKLGYY